MTKRKYNYLDHLILTAKKYEIEEYLYYEQRVGSLLLSNRINITKKWG